MAVEAPKLTVRWQIEIPGVPTPGAKDAPPASNEGQEEDEPLYDDTDDWEEYWKKNGGYC